MKHLSLLAVMLMITSATMALPVTGTFDSRTDSSIVVGAYDSVANVGGFWENVLDSLGFFTDYVPTIVEG